MVHLPEWIALDKKMWSSQTHNSGKATQLILGVFRQFIFTDLILEQFLQLSDMIWPRAQMNGIVSQMASVKTVGLTT
jgi:hypothetical protein